MSDVKTIHDKITKELHNEIKKAIRTEKAAHDLLYQIPHEQKECCFIYSTKADEIVIWWDYFYEWYIKAIIRDHAIFYEYCLGKESEKDCWIWANGSKISSYDKTVADFIQVVEKFNTKKQEDFLNV